MEWPTPRWPQATDRLFVDENDLRPDDVVYAAIVNSPLGDSLFCYAEGYKRAAEELVKFIGDHDQDQDFLVYPIIFLYRHHIELMLKELTVLASKLLGDRTKLPNGHNLKKLWELCEPLLRRIHEDDGTYGAVTNLINQLTEVDPTSESFRYHVNKEGRPCLPGIRRVNLRHFAEVMEGLTNFLDACHTAITEYLKLQREESQYHS